MTKAENAQSKKCKDYGLVSVIMPNYNGAKFIRQAVDSVLGQTYTNLELLVVDDCSTDSSLVILSEYKDERLRVIKNKVNSGAAISRNNAIKNARGRWIAFLDSDDKWHKDKLLKHIEFMCQNDLAFSFTNYLVVDENEKQTSIFCPSKDVYTYKEILKHCYVGCSTAVYDSNKTGKVYMPTNAPKREDFACWLQILKNHNGVCFHKCLTTYRITSKSVSSNKLKMIKYQWRVYRKVEKIGFFKSIYYMMNWAVLGFFKYKK